MKYTCKTCRKIFKQKIDYTRHVNRKRPCKKNSHKTSTKNNKSSHKFTCPNCHKKYVSKYTLTRHIGSYCKVLKGKINVTNKNVKNNKNDKCILEHAEEHINNANIDINNNTEKKIFTNFVKENTELVKDKTKIVKIKCAYCKSILSAKRSLKRHHKVCKFKLKYDSEQIILTEKTKLEKELEEVKSKRL